MTDNQHILFKLIRHALGTETEYSLPRDVDWSGVVDLAFEQGVAAIAADGVQCLCEDDEREIGRAHDGLAKLNSDEMEALRYEWFAEPMASEMDYAKKVKVSSLLSSSLKESGVLPISLKGFSYAAYYPVPSHRQFSDIDLFMPGTNEEGNVIAERLGATVRRDHYEEKVISLRDVTIENHKFCIGIRGSKRAKEFERQLEKMLSPVSLSEMADCGLMRPDATFNALYYVAHSVKHFCSDSLNLKQLLDWACILKNGQEEIDWETFFFWVKYMGYTDFVSAITVIAETCFNVPVRIDRLHFGAPMADGVLADTFSAPSSRGEGASLMEKRGALVFSKLRNAWKYHKILHRSVLAEVAQNVWGVVFERDPQL